ncbi:MerR family transcriptional regulator [Paenibacillus sp. MWE-103]|uniref:MerR family transcriptional regulator n=1 Tax=Paenibacillus artemisiicola TaxID=1172618 RepID=A0ABS3WEM6_9BACL|nr:MerR family transcriptional regulator [Paenibacillus artemisiicola]MBO7746767.1 MerR family transcriptional regulator [Paenibacillus artemisiicola]
MQFTIKEASERLGIPPHTIRFYEKEGLLPHIRRNESGNRVFDDEDLDWIKLMACFRITGMTISSLKRIVDLALQGDSTIPQRKAILEQHKQELQRRQAELDVAFEAVNRKLTKYESIEKGETVSGYEFEMDH